MTTDRKAEQMMLTCDEAVYTMGLIMEIPAGCWFKKSDSFGTHNIYFAYNEKIRFRKGFICTGKTIKDCILNAKSLNWGQKE